MPPEIILFATRYRRFLRLFSFWVKCTPRHWRPAFIFKLGRWLNPFNIRKDKIYRSIRLATPKDLADRTWANWLDSHLQFTLDFLNYKSLDLAWLTKDVVIADAALLESLRKAGGLLLTYHTHHQNTLCCALGLANIKISAIATSPEDSSLFPYIGDWAKRVNSDSEKHFNGGGYIFTHDLRKLISTTREVFSKQNVVLCLCDFHQPKSDRKSETKLFDRLISPPTGTIQIALKHGAPIFAAMLAPLNGRLVLTLTRLDESGGIDAIVTGYFSFLESSIRTNPACWQGWEWFEDLPFAEQANS